MPIISLPFCRPLKWIKIRFKARRSNQSILASESNQWDQPSFQPFPVISLAQGFGRNPNFFIQNMFIQTWLVWLGKAVSLFFFAETATGKKKNTSKLKMNSKRSSSGKRGVVNSNKKPASTKLEHHHPWWKQWLGMLLSCVERLGDMGSTGFGKTGFVSATDVRPNMKDAQLFFLRIGAEINQWNSPSLK